MDYARCMFTTLLITLLAGVATNIDGLLATHKKVLDHRPMPAVVAYWCMF